MQHAIRSALVFARVTCSKPLKYRAKLGMQAVATSGGKFMKGEEPFDLAKAKAIFATYADTASKMPALFPPDSKTGEKTEALPIIWEKMDDFKAKFEKFGTDAKAAEAKVTDEASFKEIFPTVQKNCGACHQTYRVKKQS